MRILICGAGRVGQGIARRLSNEQHDIVIVDADADLVDHVSAELDVRGVVGHAAYPDTLRNAGIEECEMIIAVTYHDEVNMVICQIAHSLFDVPTKIARIRAQAYLKPTAGDLFSRDNMPIDMVISPEIAVGDAVMERFRTPGAILNTPFAKGEVQVLGLEVSEDSPLLDTAIDQFRELFPDLQARLAAIGRGKTIYAPRSNDRLQAGDRAYFAVKDIEADRLFEIFGRENEQLRHVVIIGGGNIGRYVAAELEKDRSVRVRLIEADKATAEHAVMELRRTIVIHGDGLNKRILDEANIGTADFVIALTNDDKANLLISNLSKRMGVGRALALINDLELAQLSRDMKIDVVLDPRALTVSQVLLRLRRGRILSLLSLEDGRAEVVEGVALDTSPLIGKPVDYDDMPEGVSVAAIVRDGEVLFPSENLRVRSNDHLITFYELERTRKVEHFFRVSPDFF